MLVAGFLFQSRFCASVIIVNVTAYVSLYVLLQTRSTPFGGSSGRLLQTRKAHKLWDQCAGHSENPPNTFCAFATTMTSQ